MASAMVDTIAVASSYTMGKPDRKSDAGPPPPPSGGKAKKIHMCRTCHKTFNRSEHCTRHERGHTRERPFSCRYCRRRYARKDLVVRHERTLHAEEDRAYKAGQRRAEWLNSDDEEYEGTKRRRNSRQPQMQQHGMAMPGPIETVLEFTQPVDFVQPEVFLPSPRASTNNDVCENDMFDSNIDPRLQDAFPMTAEVMESLKNDDYPSRTPPTSTEDSDIHNQYGHPSSMQDMHRHSSMQQHDNFNPMQMEDAVNADQLAFLDVPTDGFDTLNFFNMLPDTAGQTALPFSDWTFGGSENSSSPGSASIGQNAIHRSQSFTQPSEDTSPVSSALEHHSIPNSTESTSFERLPRVVKGHSKNLPTIVLDNQARASIVRDLTMRMGEARMAEIQLPSAGALQRFLSNYFACFHHHFPLFHVPTFDMNKLPGPLTLAMCAIGALYRLDRKSAGQLRAWALEAVTAGIPRRMRFKQTVVRPIWEAQCHLLISFAAVFSGDIPEVLSTVEDLGHLSMEYRLRRSSLSPRPREMTTWEEWVDRETQKRLLYGMFIHSSLQVVTYNVSPGFSLTQDLDLEMPDDDALWNAPTEAQWRAIYLDRGTTVILPSVNDALNHLMFGKELPTSSMRWSAFATTIAMHAVNIHMWHQMQCTQSFSVFAVASNADDMLRQLTIAQAETALARCHNLLTQARGGGNGPASTAITTTVASSSSSSTIGDTDPLWDEAEGPLIFNALALLRISYVRAFTGTGSFNRLMLLSDNMADLQEALRAYVATRQSRTPFLTKAASRVFEGLLTPIKAGHLLVKKTAAFSWSIEHAIAGWDCALFFTKWIHTIETTATTHDVPPTAAERATLDRVLALLGEVDSLYAGEGAASLAAEVARVWASFLDDTWVWGITPRMGFILRSLATAYDEDWRLCHPHAALQM